MSLSVDLFLPCVFHLAEAMDFRDWCQSECLRLIGTKGKFDLPHICQIFHFCVFQVLGISIFGMQEKCFS